MADRSIFTTIDYNFDTLAQRFREMCYLTKGLSITLIDERPATAKTSARYTFYFEGGIVSFVRHLNLTRVPLHKPFYVDRRVGGHTHRSSAAIQRQLRRKRLHLRQQHQHRRRRHPSERLPLGA